MQPGSKTMRMESISKARPPCFGTQGPSRCASASAAPPVPMVCTLMGMRGPAMLSSPEPVSSSAAAAAPPATWWQIATPHLLLLLQSVQARTQARIRLLHLLSNVHTITPAIGGIVGALSESVPSTSRIIAAIVQNQLLTQLPISISPRSESSWKSEARDVACIWLEAALHVLGNSMAWLHARLRAWFIPLRSSRTRILDRFVTFRPYPGSKP